MLKKTTKNEPNARKPLGELNQNTLSTKRSSLAETTKTFSNNNNINKGDILYENLMRKTQNLQKDLEDLKCSFYKKEEVPNRKRCNSFFSNSNIQCSNDSFSNQQQKLVWEKGKLMELNENLIRNNAFLTNKIKLMEEREQQLMKIIDQMRSYASKEPQKSTGRDEIIGLFSKF